MTISSKNICLKYPHDLSLENPKHFTLSSYVLITTKHSGYLEHWRPLECVLRPFLSTFFQLSYRRVQRKSDDFFLFALQVIFDPKNYPQCIVGVYLGVFFCIKIDNFKLIELCVKRSRWTPPSTLKTFLISLNIFYFYFKIVFEFLCWMRNI